MDREKQAILEIEIDLIQGCINRMAQNSFLIKGWLITLIAVILGLLPEKVDVNILGIISILITVCFWYLDGFFLKTEKLYRWKYNWIIKERINSNEFYYDLDPYNKKMWLKNKDGSEKKEPWIFRVMITKTIVPLYGIILFAIIIFMFWKQIYNWIMIL